MTKTTQTNKICVVGAGAAGFFGAIRAAEVRPHAEVTLLEATRRPLTKVKVSGGGRCNVTHHCFDIDQLMQAYPRGFRELRGAFHRFQPQDTIRWFQGHGVELKTESDGRMFPTTNSSSTIIECLTQQAAAADVTLVKGALIDEISHQDSGFKLTTKRGPNFHADAILLATGSQPNGYELARKLGHTIVEPVPSLFTFQIDHPLLKDMAGQSFGKASVSLKVGSPKAKTFRQNGPLLITHWGLSGPAVLKLSAFAARELYQTDYQARLTVNLLAPDDQDTALARLVVQKASSPSKPLGSLSPLAMSRRFWQRCLAVAKIDEQQKWQQTSHKDLRRLVQFLASIPFNVQGKGEFKEEFVTCGGIKLNEVDFRTMQSRICPRLYFAGEILDIDGITGGFNFQNAWTTAWIAGTAMGTSNQSA